MIEHIAKLDTAKNPQVVAGRNAVPITDFGIRIGFANAVLHARGFFADNTLERDDLLDEPRPLLTWPFLDFLSALTLSNIDLVELGAGNSTLAFSKMFKRVASYENNGAWATALSASLPDNVTLNRFAGERLDARVVDVQPENWLLVDFAGKRTRFIKELVAQKSVSALPVVVILDNSDWYRNGAGILAEAGYVEIPFFGFKSGQTWVSCTSWFFLPDRLRLEFKAPFQQAPFSRAVSPQWDSGD